MVYGPVMRTEENCVVCRVIIEVQEKRRWLDSARVDLWGKNEEDFGMLSCLPIFSYDFIVSLSAHHSGAFLGCMFQLYCIIM